ncbi:MAG: hypothetical protein K1X39_04690 [Thermoflexales bacterium]|nr:hypothetical protein [Thermoflexales bacterium]
MEPTLAELNAKLDALTAQVARLTEYIEASARASADRAELVRDVVPIAATVMERASAHLQEIEEYVDLPDLIRLLKKVARNLPNIEKVVDLLDSGAGLMEIAGPIGKDVFNRAEATFDTLDKKGYVAFAKGGLRIVDNIVTSFSAEEVERLGDNIVLILRTVKDMTQPEIMTFLRSTVNAVEEEAAAPINIGVRALLKQMSDPKTRRGLALTLRALSTIGKTPEP